MVSIAELLQRQGRGAGPLRAVQQGVSPVVHCEELTASLSRGKLWLHLPHMLRYASCSMGLITCEAGMCKDGAES